MRNFLTVDPRLRITEIDEVVDRPIVVRVNDFDDRDLDSFIKDLDEAEATGQPVVPVVIDSYGGRVYGLLGMIAALEQCRVPVATILTSKAMSAGAALFCFGSEGHRYMHPSAAMMFHDVGTLTEGKIEDIKADVGHLDRLNRDVYKRASLAIGKDGDYLSNLISVNKHVDFFMGAKEAKRHNIVNHLYVPSFRTEISLNVTFG